MFKQSEREIKRLSSMDKKEFYAEYYGELLDEGMETEEIIALLTLQKNLGFFTEEEFKFIEGRLKNELC